MPLCNVLVHSTYVMDLYICEHSSDRKFNVRDIRLLSQTV